MNETTKKLASEMANAAAGLAQITGSDCCLVTICKKLDNGKIHTATFMGGVGNKCSDLGALPYMEKHIENLQEIIQGIKAGSISIDNGHIYGKKPDGSVEMVVPEEKMHEEEGGFAV